MSGAAAFYRSGRLIDHNLFQRELAGVSFKIVVQGIIRQPHTTDFMLHLKPALLLSTSEADNRDQPCLYSRPANFYEHDWSEPVMTMESGHCG